MVGMRHEGTKQGGWERAGCGWVKRPCPNTATPRVPLPGDSLVSTSLVCLTSLAGEWASLRRLPCSPFCPCPPSGAQCARECLWDCDISVHFSPFALHLCTCLRVTVRDLTADSICSTSVSGPLPRGLVPCGSSRRLPGPEWCSAPSVR